MTYKPLPGFMTIKKSSIHGLGLFTKRRIDKGTILGRTHWKNELEENGIIRTPLGGFINHSESPNCHLLDMGNYYVLETLRDVRRNEELTLKYKWYKLENEEEEWNTLMYEHISMNQKTLLN